MDKQVRLNVDNLFIVKNNLKKKTLFEISLYNNSIFYDHKIMLKSSILTIVQKIFLKANLNNCFK